MRRIEWLETLAGALADGATAQRVVAEPGYERWDGNGALGYLVLNAIVEAQLADPPARARLVVAGRTFPTGMLGHWTRRLADGGLVAVADRRPRRAGSAIPEGGPKLTGTNPLSIAIPSSDGTAGRRRRLDGEPHLRRRARRARRPRTTSRPFGGEHAHKAFALAVGLQLLVDALTPRRRLRRGAARRAAREPTRCRRFAGSRRGVRLPGDR